ncbi:MULTISPECIES: chloride channel protein [Methylobacterium]|jgi:H+/Cl- antiporter ClcA/predicted transcriptional regulator|uniref:Chloride channel protein n=1 Tax=Methylobacterium longum TaxID=767694 RepID=A0ABT8AIT5_9HYPH|nr:MULTISPECIES: chloride channel protein [Methylobacterium]MCJ2101424.1 chloride channel protein [Methylobacterium sp. E-046]MDN3569747.1 chloride channel protein [Methylobacterium longum]GJE11782.1 Voltage-gated ClC-type chloride channel ClcB [Methylobacterium longum]
MDGRIEIARGGDRPRRRALGDFSTDRRVLTLAGLAIITGSAASATAWVLLTLIGLVTNLVWYGRFDASLTSLAGATPGPWTVAIPVVGALIVGAMARYGSEKIRGHGIPEAMEAILIGGSRMSPKVAVLKPLSSAVAIGTGGPFGAEGPIIVTGGAVGSLFAQFFHLSAAERKTLLVAGAAAGMTAIFGTPVAAVLLAVEVLLFEWRPRSLVPVTVGAVTATCWRPLLFGAGPLFPFADNPSLPWWGLPACAALGIACGLISGLLTRTLYALEDGFGRLPLHWMWWPALGAVVVGLGGLVEPRALGVGYDVIHDLLSGHMLTGAVVMILVVKAVIWLAALSSGTSGGVLAPLLILGGAVGWLIGLLLPGAHGFWALIGMAAMLGGTLPAPLTAVVFAVEITGDVAALAPLLAATMAAYAVTVLLLKRSILTEKIARRGQHVTREYGIDPYDLARVEAVMTRSVETLNAGSPLTEALAAIETGIHHAYPVIDDGGRPVGLVSRGDALGWALEERDGDTAEGSLGERVSDADLAVVHPGDVVSHAIDVMLAAGQGRLPVTDPQSGRLVGLLTRKDLLQVRATVVRGEAERHAFFRKGRLVRRA